MNLIKNYIDLSITQNQILVAEDWIIYRYSIIISDESRYYIEEYLDNYNEGMLTYREFKNLVLDRLYNEFNSIKN